MVVKNASLPIGISDIGGPVLDTSGLSLIADTCGRLVGSITGIEAAGGVGVLTYVWQETNSSDTIGITDSLINVGAGVYTLTVYDVAGCQSISGPYTLTEIQGATINGTVAIVDDHCTQGIGAISGITTSGGTGNVVFSWSDGTAVVGSTLDLSGLFAGNYTLTVSDEAGCQTVSAIHPVLNIGGPILDTTNRQIDSSACNVSIGSISGVTASGGIEPYSWAWYNGATLVDSVQNLSGVPAGDYTVLVTDSLGCTDSSGIFTVVDAASVTINIIALHVDTASCGLNVGSIDSLTVSGGTAPYTYSWSNGTSVIADSLNIDNLAAGNYTLTVSDFNLCQVSVGPIPIYGTNALQIDLGSGPIQPSCNIANGEISGAINGGNPTFITNWTYNGNPFSNSLTINSLDTGSYHLTVSDVEGCFDTVTVVLVNQSAGNVSALNDSYVTEQNVTIQTDPSRNDNGGGSLVVLQGPLNGTFSPGLLYTPNSGFTGLDSLTYQVCDLVCTLVCDTATIFIDVTKEKVIKINTGFSPNGDDINEVFFIENIEFYPENELIIYSRWGDEVYAAQPYNNQWDGSSEATGVKLSGNKVVDGAYYFILKLTPDSEPINGFIDLRR